MSDLEKNKIRSLIAKGFGYKKIAKELSINENTAKSICRNIKRNEVIEDTVNDDNFCKYCGGRIEYHGGKHKKFCSYECKVKWWNENRSSKPGTIEIKCPVCKKIVKAYANQKKKYCSFECYLKGRYQYDKVAN